MGRVISYVTAHHGRWDDLERCISSVKGDKTVGLNAEIQHHIWLDGYGVDEIPRRIRHNSTIQLYGDTMKRGKSYAVNRIVEQIDTEFVSFLDSDDMVIRGKTSAQVAEFDAYLGIKPLLLGSNYLRWDRSTGFREVRHPVTDKEIKLGFWRYPYMLYSSLMVRQEDLLAQCEVFKEGISGGIDYEFYHRAFDNFQCRNLDAPLVIYTFSESGITMSSKTRKEQLRQHAEVIERLFRFVGCRKGVAGHTLMPLVLGTATIEQRLQARVLIVDAKAAIARTGSHSYFPRSIDSSELMVYLDSIEKALHL